MQSDKRFNVALSFPGEYRNFVQRVAEVLSQNLNREQVFYDKWYEAELARPNLDTYLQRIYHDHAELIVVFLCAEYEKKAWCGLEWRAIRNLLSQKQDEAIMPIRFDDTVIPGLYSIDGYVNAANREPEEIADLILERFNPDRKSKISIVLPIQTEHPLPLTWSSSQPTDDSQLSNSLNSVENSQSVAFLVLEMDSRTLQQNLVNLQKQGTLEECREVITQTSQWLLKHPTESYVRNQLLKLVQSKATVDQQRQIIDETTLWLLANLEAGNPYVLTEYLKLVTSQGTPEQGQSAVSLTLKWFEQVQQNDAYVRRNCLILARDKATSETAQDLLNQTYSWLSENLEECDSYVMTEYLRLVISRGTVEQQQKAKEQAAIWLEKADDSFVRTQYLKLLKIIG